MQHELWFTAILNRLFGGLISSLLGRAGVQVDSGHPIPNYLAMEILVVLIILVGAFLLRRQLSVENPGRFQQVMEVFVEFVRNMNEEIIGHDGPRYVAMIGTLGIFVALCNLLGLIPTLETPTAKIQVTLGCAAAAFLYYNFQGIRTHGVVGYLKHLSGPMLAIALLMFPIEIFSNVFRMLSLSVRLYANMMVGDLLDQVFGGLVPIVVPVVFDALHMFVSVLQAYIFMLLPAIYISMAVSEEH